ncbi:unnamed protein product [Alternaria alternata]
MGEFRTPFSGPASNGQPPSFGYHGDHESDRHQVPVDGPPWSSYDGMPNHGPPMPSSGRSMSAQWYAEPGHLDRVQEEVTPPMAYHHQGLPQFYSGA